ncbi:MAG: tetratricopeptide repeat protein [Ectothiorhodospiraceae bacterium]|nr:tetratricopeptide repeat protein [Ectothiorhodospiraceae bacterium]
MRAGWGVGLLAVLLLGGCAGMGPAQDEWAEDPLRVLERPAPAPEEEDLYFQLLLAEFAGARGQLGAALDAYLRAMNLTQDPEVAARATRLSLYANRDADGIRAARRWVELDPDEIAARQALGMLYVRTGETERARRELRTVLMQAGDQAGDAIAELGAGIAREEDRDAVLEVLQALAAEFPGLPEAQLVLAQAALQSGRPELALSAAREGLRRDPDSRQLQVMEGQALLELDRLDDGIAVFEALVERRPGDDELRLYLARVLLQAGRDQDALVHFKRLLEDRPNDVGVLYATGLLTLEEGHPDLARPYFLRLIELGERRNEAAFFLGRIAEDLGDIPDAMDWYRQVRGEYRPQATLRAAILQKEAGDLEAARTTLRDFRQRHPDDAVRGYLIEADLLRQAEAHDEAKVLYDRALSQYPGDMELLYGRGILHAVRRDVDRAEADFRAVLERDPDHVHALNALGYTLVDLTDRVEEGFALIRRAYAQEPDNGPILDSMGWAHFRLGRYDQALDYLRRAYDIMPDPEVAAHLGEVLWTMGQRDQARDAWRRGLELDAEHPVLRDTLDRLAPELLDRGNAGT